jgi:NADH-quinone oxidoreductase subunit G
MPKLTIDGIEITVEPGTSILQAAEQLGVEIPRFCYHDRLSVPANCRMCLVEVEVAPKPVASCALPCGDDMKVITGSDKVHKARQGVMEFLLINHPLDCPICDQGGECDLQDQSVAYGYDRSRYTEGKRAVKNKDLGPLVATHMNRCIQCTRCIRFADEIAGVSELGLLGRGEVIEIGTYVEQMITSELSGNLIDVCPVGALVSAPYQFKARPWELTKTETIDVSDAVGSNIRVDSRGNEVMRVLPRLHEDVNEEWISDKTRFAYDGLMLQRLDQPYIRENKKLRPASWEEAFNVIASRFEKLDGKEIGAIVGNLSACEEIKALKDFMTSLGSPHMDCRMDGAVFDTEHPASYLFNTTIAGLEDADAILLVGTNPRWEAPMINARIRKAHLANPDMPIGVIGEQADLNYPYDYLGAGAETLSGFRTSRSDFVKAFKAAKKPVLILGAGALCRKDGKAIQALAAQVAEEFEVIGRDWNGFNMLHTAASRVGALSLGFVPGQGGYNTQKMIEETKSGKIKALYLMGADELPFDQLSKKAFVVYQGHHGDHGAMHADVILPGAAYTEKNGVYMNTEGRPQIARQAVFPPGEARPDWKIIRALSEFTAEFTDGPLPYNHLQELRAEMIRDNPAFAGIDQPIESKWQSLGAPGKVTKTGFTSPVKNFYQTDAISRASRIMAECRAAFFKKDPKKTGTNG